MTTTAPRHRRFQLMLAMAATAAVLLTGCGDDTSSTPAPQQVATATADPTTPTTPSTPAPPVADPTVVPADDPADDQSDPVADFPLDAGWSDDEPDAGYGPEFPVDELNTSFAQYACGGPAPTPEVTDTLLGQYLGHEYYASRELLVFDDADAAVGYLAELQSFYEGCPPQRSDDESYPLRVFDTAVGGESFGVVRTTVSDDGSPETGLLVMQADRVGRSILLAVTAGDGNAADDAEAHALTDYLTETSADVVAAQCAFTEAGC